MVQDLNDLLQAAVDHHRASRLDAAEIGYRKILSVDPENVDTLHLLGVLAGQTGYLDHAVELIGKAVSLRPSFHEAYANLGRLLSDGGKFNESLDAYRRVVDLRQHDAVAWYALGVAQRRCKNEEAARSSFTRALLIDASLTEVRVELAKLDRIAGRLEEAVAGLRAAIQQNPDLANAHHALGNVWVDKNDLPEAIKAFSQASELSPGSSEFHASLGDALCSNGKHTEAIASYNSALILNPDLLRGRQGMAMALSGLGRYEEAVAFHLFVLERDPDSSVWWNRYGDTLFSNGDVSGSEKAMRKALDLDSVNVAAWVGLGVALRAVGNFEEAAKCFRKALSIRSDDTAAYKCLASISDGPATKELEHLLSLLNSPDLTKDERISAGFGLAKLLDDADRFDEAFHWYAEANSLYRSQCKEEDIKFDREALQLQVDMSIEVFTRDFFKDRKDWGDLTELPVFVVGMPRSGTTLLEQVAASHPEVFGAGELTSISGYAGLLKLGTAAKWEREKVFATARSHHEHLAFLGGKAVRVVDKMPGNIMHLGLIATLFPAAKIIFSHRDARDNCLSCYFQWFKKKSILFSYDLADCAFQYREQQRLTAHWLKALPLQMMTMQYEDLVADLEGQSRRLIDFLGLEWEPACLDFHKTERPIATASVWQVRQPLYNSSVGRWRHYEKHLGPLLEALKGAV